MYSIQELRAFAEGSSTYLGETPEMTLDEMAQLIALDEAYFGKKPVAKIQTAMDAIYDVVMDKPDVNLLTHPAGKALNKAICDVFGFKSCTVYWSSRPYTIFGPCTMTRSKIIHGGNRNFQYGTFQNGFYDKTHELNVVISMDQTLFVRGGLTSSEMVAVILHEIGHNFDYSIWTIISDWWLVGAALIGLSKGDMSVLKQLPLKVAMKEIGIIPIAIINIDDMVTKLISPLNTIVQKIGPVGYNIYKLINMIRVPVKLVKKFPQIIMDVPMRYITNTLMRHGEIYADSFSTSYGYGAELNTGLEKIKLYTKTVDGVETLDPIMTPFNDITMLVTDFYGMILGGHGSGQQRFTRSIEKLNRDLDDSGLTAADKKAIKDERDRLVKAYNEWLEADEGTRKTITSTMRKMMDSWYNGSAHDLISNIDTADSYAK